MKRFITAFSLFIAVALVISACSSNVSVVKRQYNKGWNISLGGGKNGQFERPTRLERVSPEAVAKAEVSPEVIEVSSSSLEAVESPAPSAAVVASPSTPENPAAKVAVAAHKAAVASKAVAKAQAQKQAPAEKKKAEQSSSSGKSQWIALALVLLLPGFHRFYLGYYLEGVLFILTAGGCGIWWIIDLVRILTGDLGPADGSGYTEEI